MSSSEPIRSTIRRRQTFACSALGTDGCAGPARPCHERSAFLIRLADLLDARAETYGRLITAEMGKPLPDAIAEIKKSARDARHKAEAGEAYLRPQPIPGYRRRLPMN